MGTDRALPGILGNAAAGVDGVSGQLAHTAAALISVTTRSLVSWSGPASQTWNRSCMVIGRELISQAQQADELAGVLRRAAKSASERIYYEDLAAEAARRRAEEAARAEAAAKTKNR